MSKCDKAEEEVVNAIKELNRDKNQREREKKKRVELDKLTKARPTGTQTSASSQSQSQKPLTQTSIVSSLNASSKTEADAAVARFFYANGIPFSVVISPNGLAPCYSLGRCVCAIFCWLVSVLAVDKLARQQWRLSVFVVLVEPFSIV